jgi:hypothetical protein
MSATNCSLPQLLRTKLPDLEEEGSDKPAIGLVGALNRTQVSSYRCLPGVVEIDTWSVNSNAEPFLETAEQVGPNKFYVYSTEGKKKKLEFKAAPP